MIRTLLHALIRTQLNAWIRSQLKCHWRCDGQRQLWLPISATTPSTSTRRVSGAFDMAALRTTVVGQIQTSTRPVSDSKYMKCHIQFECVLRVISLRSAKQFWIYFSLVLVCGKNAPSRTLVSATDEHHRFPFDFHCLFPTVHSLQAGDGSREQEFCE